MKQEFGEWAQSLTRMVTVQGVSVKRMDGEVADPTPHLMLNLKMVASSIGVPMRIFIGTEEAQLAGAQDEDNFNDRIENRQSKHCGPNITRPTIERLIMMGVLDYVEDFEVGHEPLATLDEVKRATIIRDTVDAIAKYITSGADALIPPLEFLTEFIGLDEETARAILTAALSHIATIESDDETAPGHIAAPDMDGGDVSSDDDESDNDPPPKTKEIEE